MESRIKRLEDKVAYLEKQLQQLQAATVVNNSDQSSGANETTDEKKFKKAITSISDGIDVPVHLLRKQLNWKHSFFDQMIQLLLEKKQITLEQGEMLDLNIRQLNDSYMNDKGETFTRISWKEQ